MSIDALSFAELIGPERIVAALYFYCDESGKYRKNPVVTVAGVGAVQKRMSRFNGEWNSLLRAYEIQELHMSRVMQLSQTCGPKMPSGQTLEERIRALYPFADCINDHLEIGLLQGWDVQGYARLSTEVKKWLGGSHDPFQLAFIRGLLEIVRHVREDDIVSIIIDDDEVTAWDTYLHYRAVKKVDSELESRLVSITFAKSKHLAPLQAADMVAFLARREATEKFWKKPNEFKLLFDYLADGPRQGSSGTMRWFVGFQGENEMVNLANSILGLQNAQRNTVSEIRPNNGETPESSAQ